MRYLGLVLILATMACGGGGGAAVPDAGDVDAAETDAAVPDAAIPDAEVPDAGIPDAQVPDAEPDSGVIVDCNPVSQAGCGVDEKCTWVRVTPDFGHVDCVPDGTVATGGACVMGPDGETTGYDDCLGGNLCIGGTCQQICSTSPDSCPSTSTCKLYAGLFDVSTVGVCDFLCDPVTQSRSFDSAPACGSADPGTPNRGCYGVFDFAFACAPVPATVLADPLMYDQNDTAYGPMAGTAYLNGCAPGYAPLLRATAADTSPVICMALCTPGPTSLENPANANGLVGSGHTCADRGAPGPAHECRYFWVFESDPTQHPDALGFCWNPDNYVGDWDGDPGTTDTSYPRCAAIAIADQAGMGCAPSP